MLAERTILEGLKAGGLLRGDVGAMVEARLGAVFMPHGARERACVPLAVPEAACLLCANRAACASCLCPPWCSESTSRSTLAPL